MTSLVTLLAVSGSTNARAAERLVWNDAWPRFRPVEYAGTAAMFAGIGVMYAFVDRNARWNDGVLFDSAIRDRLRADTLEGSRLAGHVSTWTYYGLVAWPILIDAGLVAGVVRRSPDVALQLALIDAQSIAIAGFVFRMTETFVARARPYAESCLEEGTSKEECFSRGTNSFLSGHVVSAATGAALMCSQHAMLGLYGHRAADAAACTVAVAGALATGVGRIVSDNHWTTDVLASYVIGGVAGWVVPSLLHFGFDGRGLDPKRRLAWIGAPYAVRGGAGAMITGAF